MYILPQSQFQHLQCQCGRVAAFAAAGQCVVNKILHLPLIAAVYILLIVLHRAVRQGQRALAEVGQIAAVPAEKLDAAPVAAAEVVQMHLRQQRGIFCDVNRKIVRVDLQLGVGPLEIVQLFRHAEKLDQIIPLMDQVDGDAAAQRLAGTVDRAVVHAGPPVGQIA